MTYTTTINGTDYKTDNFGNIQITADYYITRDDEKRTRRGLLIHKAGWNVYYGDGARALSQHGDDQAAAVEAAKAAQVARDERTAAKAKEQPAEATAEAERKTPIKKNIPLATPRQVDYIWSLICQGRHEEGGFYNGPTTLDGIRKMTKASASIYINSLTDNY